MTFKGMMNADLFIDYLRRLIKGSDKPTCLIVDGHPVHRSKAVKVFVEEHQEQLELHCLSSCSPELNPIEQVWNHAKKYQIGKQPITGPDQMKKLVISVAS